MPKIVSPKSYRKKEEKIFINGNNIHIGVWYGQRHPIICLHGLSGNLHSMEPFAKKLHKLGHKVISYDLRGRGHSDKPKLGYGFEQHIQDLHQVIQHYKLNKPILLAHSFGCMIALRYALRFPNQIQSMILLDGGGLLSISKRIQILKVLKQSFDRLDVKFASPSEYIQLVKNSPLIPKWTKKIERYFLDELHMVENGYVCHMPKYVMEEELKAMGGSISLGKVFLNFLLHPIQTLGRMIQNKHLDFENIHTPLLILRATKMNLFPNDDLLPKESYEEMLTRLPNAKGMELSTNHYGILFDDLTERDNAIQDFIKSTSLRNKKSKQ